MSTHQTNKDKPRAQKWRHFCFSFDLHNYCPTCREAGKGDDPCVTFETPCDICASFTDDQMKKIQHRKRYLKKQKAETNTKDDELDLLGEGDGDSFTGSNADLESAADNLFTSPPGLPRINLMRNPMNLGSHLLNLKSTLIRVQICVIFLRGGSVPCSQTHVF